MDGEKKASAKGVEKAPSRGVGRVGQAGSGSSWKAAVGSGWITVEPAGTARTSLQAPALPEKPMAPVLVISQLIALCDRNEHEAAKEIVAQGRSLRRLRQMDGGGRVHSGIATAERCSRG